MNNPTQTPAQSDQEIALALGISDSSPELQAKVVAKFGEILFKRLLLLLPDTIAKNVIAEITVLPLPEGMERLIALLDEHLPNAALRRNEVLKETIAQFRS